MPKAVEKLLSAFFFVSLRFDNFLKVVKSKTKTHPKGTPQYMASLRHPDSSSGKPVF
jgi:hypothetical protein